MAFICVRHQILLDTWSNYLLNKTPLKMSSKYLFTRNIGKSIEVIKTPKVSEGLTHTYIVKLG